MTKLAMLGSEDPNYNRVPPRLVISYFFIVHPFPIKNRVGLEHKAPQKVDNFMTSIAT